ncbi:uncharacterized protein isoform X3 [Takifugu rubripes]|uniref:uncharacterized protein isoform X3 n=1 Tax=Takifugu rubripes TaxID=31033 RepID=UPI001145ECF0|nr:uncharacterized protein LOC115247326 isoform X3 [Takifugu rubripes]
MATSLHSTPPADSCLMLGNPLSSVQLWSALLLSLWHFQTTTNIILLSMAVSDLLFSTPECLWWLSHRHVPCGLRFQQLGQKLTRHKY